MALATLQLQGRGRTNPRKQGITPAKLAQPPGPKTSSLDGRRGQLCHRGALLHVKQGHLLLRPAQQHAGAGVEDVVGGGQRGGDLLGDLAGRGRRGAAKRADMV